VATSSTAAAVALKRGLNPAIERLFQVNTEY
jgi:hypothetical protein